MINDRIMKINDGFISLSKKEWFRENYWLQRLYHAMFITAKKAT